MGVALGTGPTLPAVASGDLVIEEVRVPVGADMNVCVCTCVAGTKTALHVCTYVSGNSGEECAEL